MSGRTVREAGGRVTASPARLRLRAALEARGFQYGTDAEDCALTGWLLAKHEDYFSAGGSLDFEAWLATQGASL